MNQSKFPKVNFIGNKEKLSDWITKEFPKDSESVLDLLETLEEDDDVQNVYSNVNLGIA